MINFKGRLIIFGASVLFASNRSDAQDVQRRLPLQPEAAIWFHPQPTGNSGPFGPIGSTDYLSLFTATAPWPRAMGRTHVMGFYAGWIAAASDQVLQPVVAFLNAHDMSIELEAPALQATATCGSGVEGYVPYGQSLHDFTVAYLQRLQALGANLQFIKVDEPYYFGSVVNDPRSCHFSVSEVASAVAAYTQLVRTVYPNAAVGDVEPIIAGGYGSDVVTALGQWHDAYQTIAGAPFPFFFADIDFSNSAWPTIVKSLEDSTRQCGIAFGIIYIGDPTDLSDQEWAAKVVARFETYEGVIGGRPSYALFQSWEPHPLFCLPETDPTTFTGVIDAYINARLHLGPTPEDMTGRMAFVSQQNSINYIYLMDVDASGKGADPVRLTSDAESEDNPQWSPDGTRLVYQRGFNGAATYVINADGTGQQRLSPTPGFDVTPSWSPDGTKIIYARLYQAPQPNMPPMNDIRIMNADGTGDHAILTNTLFSVEPKWSVKNQVVFMSLMNGSGYLQIYTMNVDGTGLRQLTGAAANSADPVWSPDGTRISFGSDREGGNKLNIFAMNADGSQLEQLTRFQVPDEAGDTNWSSDGRKIAFEWDINGMKQSNPNAYAEVWTMNANGSGEISTGVPCSGVGCAPRWQPRKTPER
jgi:Tol biopolymer transport system component